MIRNRSSGSSNNLKLWGKCKNFETLKQAHAYMIINGFNSDRSALREIIYVSAVALRSTIHYAHQLFVRITEPDQYMWNTMMRGSAQSPNPFLAVSLYTQMEKEGVRADNYTFPFVLKACAKLCWVNVGCVVHGKIVKHGFEWNKFSRNTLIYFHANCGDIGVAKRIFDESVERDVVSWSALTAGYARRGDLGVARKLFEEMPVKDLVSWNVMITGYVKRGEMGSARELFDEVPKRDIVTWNAMIAGYVVYGLHKKAFEMFDEMIGCGELPDDVTMLSLISSCAITGALDVGEKIHCSILDRCKGDMSIVTGNALIDMYAKCGNIEKATSVFRGMKDKLVSTWNSVIVGLAFHGHSEESIGFFKEMLRLNWRPNEITFIGVLIACSHAGKVGDGRRFFKLMQGVYNIEPNIKHYGCMVDMLGRAGLLDEAFGFIDSMDIEPNGIIWRTLLGACRVHNNVELAKRANDRLLKLRQDESGDYVLLSNVYASRGEWDGAERVRKLMDDSGVWKAPAFSSTDGDNRALMHFLLDSESHKDSQKRTL